VVDESLGTKRTCPECSARFYDLNKSPIECPKCGAAFTVEPILPSKLDQQAKPDEVKPDPVEEEEEAGEVIAADDASEVAAADVDEAAAIADVDLGDVADVNVTPSEDEFLETDDEDAPVEEIIPLVKPEDES